MNMVRIRHIMEMRRACKAPPLLPPKLRKEASESSDRRGVKDVLDINFRVQIVSPERFTSRYFVLQLFESSDGLDGPWNRITTTERLDIDETYDLEDVFGIEFTFERLQWIRIEIIELSDAENTTFRASEVLNIAQVAASSKLLQFIDQNGYRLAEIEVWSQLRERSQPIMMQLEAKNLSNKFISSNSNMFFEIYKIEDDDRKLLYRSELLKQTKLVWKPFTIQPSDFSGQISICCCSDDEKEGIVGQTVVSWESLKSSESILLYNETYKQGRKSCCEIRVIRFQHLKIYSFLDYIKSRTSLRFGIAIDFSVREQLSHEEQIQYAKDVEFAVKSIGETVEPFNSTNSFLSYGFGAKIPPQNRDSNNFCLSLDVEASCQGVNGVLNSFLNCYQRVQPLQSAKFSQIIYHLARNSQKGLNKDSCNSNYFVLFVITRGSIDDLKETVQAAIFSSKSPISIVFIGVGCDGLDEIERIGNAGRRLEYQGRKSERDNLQFVNATKTRLECDNLAEMTSSFLERSLQQIPWQMTTFFMQNHVTPEKTDEVIMSRSSTISPGSSSVEKNDSGHFEDFEEPRCENRANLRGSTSDIPRSRRKGLTSEMRSLTIDDMP